MECHISFFALESTLPNHLLADGFTYAFWSVFVFIVVFVADCFCSILFEIRVSC